MDFLNLTRQRFSCRNYKSQRIEDNDLEYILECARMAPSAVNRQPWLFKVITSWDSHTALQDLWQCYDREWFRSAPACIVVVLRHDEEWVRADGKRHGDIDVAIASEHICLAAAERGLGTCWVCNFDAERCRQMLRLGEEEEPVVLIPIGYPACDISSKTRKGWGEICDWKVIDDE